MNWVSQINPAGVLKSTSIYKLVATLRTSGGFSRDIRTAAWTLDKLRAGWCWRNNCVCDLLDANAPNWNLNHLFARWAINQLRRHFLRRINRLTALRTLKMDVWHKNVRSHLTKKAEPRGNGDVANQNAQAQNGCAQPRWLRRLVRPHHISTRLLLLQICQPLPQLANLALQAGCRSRDKEKAHRQKT